MLERRTVEEGQLYFEGGPDRDLADEAVRSGLTLLVLLLEVARKIGLPVREDQIKAAIDRLIKSYSNRPNKHIL
jgi:FKBP-type peptidyl-prolyl cis-trans isomerase (trigger factor)